MIDYTHPARPRPDVRPGPDGVVRLTRPGDTATLTMPRR